MYQLINDFSMSYDYFGSGVPLLMIHGYPLSRKLWQPQAGLADIARVIAPDLRGHGDSSNPNTQSDGPIAYPMDMLASDCAELLDALSINTPVVVCGLSMGGYITFAFYRKYPQRVAGLILAATRSGMDTPEGKSNRKNAVDTVRRSGVEAIAESMLPRMMSPNTYAKRPELAASVMEIMRSISVQGVIGDQLGMSDRSDSTPLLSQIDKPTLIIHGTDDQLIPLAEAETMHSAIADSTLKAVPDAGHLVNLEQPFLFNQAVREFLTQFV